MTLPVELQGQFRGDLQRFEEERRMPYLSSIERLAKEEGRAEALQKTVLRLGGRRFGEPGKEIAVDVAAITDVDRLERLTEQLLQASNWEELLETP